MLRVALAPTIATVSCRRWKTFQRESKMDGGHFVSRPPSLSRREYPATLEINSQNQFCQKVTASS